MADVGHELELAWLHRERQHDERERETTRREEKTTNGCAAEAQTRGLQPGDPAIATKGLPGLGPVVGGQHRNRHRAQFC